jgi:hypothetical protein
LLLFAHLPIQRKPHLALLPSAELAPDKNGHTADAAKSLLQRLGPGEAGAKLVAVEKRRDAARFEQLLDGDHRCSIGAVVAEEELECTHIG